MRISFPLVIMRSSTAQRLRASAKKYRVLRGHVRKDGALKLALPKQAAYCEARRLTKIHGKKYTAYGCPFCDDMFHTGCLREES